MTATLRSFSQASDPIDEERPQFEFATEVSSPYVCDNCSEYLRIDDAREHPEPRLTRADARNEWHLEPASRRNQRTWLLIREGLVRSGYRLKDVNCTVDETTVCLTGTVHRYFHLQIAVEIARKLAAGRRIDLQIAVISKSPGFGAIDHYIEPASTRHREDNESGGITTESCFSWQSIQ